MSAPVLAVESAEVACCEEPRWVTLLVNRGTLQIGTAIRGVISTAGHELQWCDNCGRVRGHQRRHSGGLRVLPGGARAR